MGTGAEFAMLIRDEFARRGGYPWTAADDQILRACAHHGEYVDTVAALLGRSDYSVWWRCKRLGLSIKARRGHRFYNSQDDETLRAMVAQGASPIAAANHLKRSQQSVVARARRLHVRFASMIRTRGSLCPWTAEKLEQAKAWWLTGKCGSWIADSLGGNFTRSAVIAKLHREGCKRAPQPRQKLSTKRKHKRAPAKPATPRPATPRRGFWWDFKSPPKAPQALPTDTARDVARVSHLNLDSSHCRWVIGDIANAIANGEPLYCGKPHLSFHPYCAEHAARAYRFPMPAEAERRWLPAKIDP